MWMAAAGKGFYWVVLVAIFGLVQLWINFGYLVFRRREVSFYILTKDGGVLFFALAITIGLTVDYFFHRHGGSPMSVLKATAFVFYPLIITGFTVASYLMSLLAPQAIEPITLLNWIVVTATAVYAIAAKSYMFYQETRAYGSAEEGQG